MIRLLVLNFACILFVVDCASDTPQMERFFLTEDADRGYILGNLHQKFGVSRPADITFVQQGIAGANYFLYDEVQGHLKTKMKLDRDVMCENSQACCSRKRVCSIELKFIILMSEVRYVSIDIEDRNDHTPQFASNSQTFRISEKMEANPNTRLRLALASDPDSIEYSVKNYELKSVPAADNAENSDEFFLYVETASSTDEQHTSVKAIFLQLKRGLDRERREKYEFALLAVDGGTPALTGTTTLTVIVLDENDNYPQFKPNAYEVEVDENRISHNFIQQVHATDLDQGINARVVYRLDEAAVASTITERFRVNSHDGKVYLRQALDYETQALYKVPIIATDLIHPVTSTTTLIVRVRDINDEAPTILVDYLAKSRVEIEENKPAGMVLAFISVKDKDHISVNGDVKCQLRLDEQQQRYELKKTSADNSPIGEYFLRTLVSLDREKLANDLVSVVCMDSGTVSLSSTATISLTVLDVNDNIPVISLRNANNVITKKAKILENASPNSFVVKVFAADEDNGKNGTVTFNIDKSDPTTLERFKIKSLEGNNAIISSTMSLDREATQPAIHNFSVIVTACDGGGQCSERRFFIELLDINDNAPEFEKQPQMFSVKEEQPAGTNLGQILVKDIDNEANIQVSIHPDDFRRGIPFEILHVTATEDKVSLNFLVTNKRLDCEKQDKYEFRLIARDGNGHDARSSTGTVHIQVIDINDNSPVIVFPSDSTSNHSVSYRENIGYTIMKVIANDKDIESQNKGGINFNGQFFFTLKSQYERDDMFEIDPSSGKISVNRKMTAADKGAKLMTVTVADQGQPRLQNYRQFTIVVDDSAPQHSSKQFNTNSPSNGGAIGPEENGDSNDFNIMLIVLVFFVFLLMACLMLLFYIRYWGSRRTSNNSPLSCFGVHENLSTDKKGDMELAKGFVPNDLELGKTASQCPPNNINDFYMTEENQSHQAGFNRIPYIVTKNYDSIDYNVDSSSNNSAGGGVITSPRSNRNETCYGHPQLIDYDGLILDSTYNHSNAAMVARSKTPHFYQTLTPNIEVPSSQLHQQFCKDTLKLSSPYLTSKRANEIDAIQCRELKSDLVKRSNISSSLTGNVFPSVQASFV